MSMVSKWDAQTHEILIGTSFNRDSIKWDEAPLPKRLHRHTIQTREWIMFRYIDYCACGATRVDYNKWHNRNSRRKASKK